MSLFNFSPEEIFTFFAVLVRYSVFFSLLPFVGDRMIPAPVKVLTSMAIAFALFPALVSSGYVNPKEAAIWGATTGGIVGTIALEMILGFLLGYTARLLFEGISFGANLVGNFMGFASASTYDPHQESQTEVIAQMQMAIAMLIFLSVDGHHLMLKATLDSYRIVGIGKLEITPALSQRLIRMTSDVILFGIQIAAPVAVSLFSVNIVFGVLSKTMPQLNVFTVSFAITALMGFIVLFLGMPEFSSSVVSIFGRMNEWLEAVMYAAVNRR